MEADLLTAERLFTETKSNIYASKEAVWALLSRLYLYKEENELAIEYANRVIDSGRFNLLSTNQLPDYPKLTPEQNQETIFAIRFVRDADYPSNGWFTVGSLYATIQGTGWGEMYASRPILEKLREYPEDVRNQFISPVVVNPNVTWAIYVDDSFTYRWKVVTQEGDDYVYTENGQTYTLQKEATSRGYNYFVNTAEGPKRALIDNQLDVRNGFPKYFILKSSGQEDQVHLWSPVVSRLAEMYLNRAEANAKLGNIDLALADVNLIRDRAGILPDGHYNLSNIGDRSVLDVVLDERQLELAYEGHRKLDVFRNRRVMDREYPGTHLATSAPLTEISYQDNAIIEFIPESQILIHEGLTQNP